MILKKIFFHSTKTNRSSLTSLTKRSLIFSTANKYKLIQKYGDKKRPKLQNKNNNPHLKKISKSIENRNPDQAKKILDELIIYDQEEEEIFVNLGFIENKNLLINWSRNNWNFDQKIQIRILNSLRENFNGQKGYSKFLPSQKIQMLFSLGKIKILGNQRNRIVEPKFKHVIFEFMKDIILSVSFEFFYRDF